jgi:hypothetical protein
MMKVGQKLHQAGATPEAGAEQKADDWVVDAEVESDDKDGATRV